MSKLAKLHILWKKQEYLNEIEGRSFTRNYNLF